MTKAEIIEKVNSILMENFDLTLDQLKPDAHLIQDLHLDSLDAVDMLVHLEENLGKKLNVEKLREAHTLQDVYTLVEEIVRA